MATVNTELLTNRPSLTPTTGAKSLPGVTNGALKPAKPTAPRIDLQPLYTTLKELVGDKWQSYITIVAEFMLGMGPKVLLHALFIISENCLC